MITPIEGPFSSRRPTPPMSPLTPPPASPSMPDTKISPREQLEDESTESTTSPRGPAEIILRVNKRPVGEMSTESAYGSVETTTATSDAPLPSDGVPAEMPKPVWKEVDWNPAPRSSAFSRRFKELAPEEKRIPRTATGLDIDRSVVVDPDYKMDELTRLAYQHQGIIAKDDKEDKTRATLARRIQVSGARYQMTEEYLTEYFSQFCSVRFEGVREMKLVDGPEDWTSLELEFATAKEAAFCFKTLDLHPTLQMWFRYIMNSPNMDADETPEEADQMEQLEPDWVEEMENWPYHE